MLERKLALEPYAHHIDWYDHMFDRRAEGVPVWKRNTRDDFPSRRKQFDLLVTPLPSGAYHHVPPHGVKGDVRRPARWACGGPESYALGPFKGLDDDTEVVAYLDEAMHQGMGKERMRFADVPDGVFWARYMPTEDGKGHSRRQLFIGHDFFVELEYRSEDWRSNYQTTSVEVTKVEDVRLSSEPLVCWAQRHMRNLKSPLLAIDSTRHRGEWWATDFNLAPGFEACIRDHLTPTQVVDTLKKFYFRHCAEG